MMTNEDLKRLTGDEQVKKHKLDNLAKACAEAQSDEMKALWYNKLKKLAEDYNMMEYFRKLIH